MIEVAFSGVEKGKRMFDLTTYPKLKLRKLQLGIKDEDVAGVLGKSRSYVADRLNAKQDRYFNINEMFIIGKFLMIPEDELLEYFSIEQRNRKE